MSNLKTVVYQRIEAIADAEKVTREELKQLSRELLMYVPDSQDIDSVNRLLGVVTPVNKRALILFFKHFLPWSVEQDNDGNFQRFGKKMDGDKKVAKRLALIEEFLKVEENNFWTWGEANIKMDKVDLAGPIAAAINRALKGNEKRETPALTPIEIVTAIMSSDLNTMDLLTGVEAMQRAAEEAAAQVEAEEEVKEAA